MNTAFRLSKTNPVNFDHPDIVLIQAPLWSHQSPPMSLACLAAYLRAAQLRVLPLDLNIEFIHLLGGRFIQVWENLIKEPLIFSWVQEKQIKFIEEQSSLLDEMAKQIVATGTKIVGFSVQIVSSIVSLYLARKIKSIDNSIVIIFGGRGVSKYLMGREIILDNCVDIVVHGEGEETLLDLVRRIKSGITYDDCLGVILFRNNKVLCTADRPLIKDINGLPFPDFSDYEIRNYTAFDTLPFIVSRGCINRCFFCDDIKYWRRFRSMSGQRMFAQLIAYLRKYPFIKKIEFLDSLINGDIKELEVFADLVIASGLQLQWTSQVVMRKEMTYELFLKLKKSGCLALIFGLETSSSVILQKCGKYHAKDVDQGKIIKDCFRSGIKGFYYIMFGLPGETDVIFQETIDLIRRNKDFISGLYPNPNLCFINIDHLTKSELEKYDLNPHKPSIYWESMDGSNNYRIRLSRFISFCKAAKDFNISFPDFRVTDEAITKHEQELYFIASRMLGPLFVLFLMLMFDSYSCDPRNELTSSRINIDPIYQDIIIIFFLL